MKRLHDGRHYDLFGDIRHCTIAGHESRVERVDTEFVCVCVEVREGEKRKKLRRRSYTVWLAVAIKMHIACAHQMSWTSRSESNDFASMYLCVECAHSRNGCSWKQWNANRQNGRFENRFGTDRHREYSQSTDSVKIRYHSGFQASFLANPIVENFGSGMSCKTGNRKKQKKKWKYLQTINTYTLCFMETVSSKHLQVQCQGSLKIELTHAQRSRAPLTHSLRFPTHMDDLCRASEHSWRRSRTFQLFYRINQSAVASCKRQEKRTPSN